MTSPPVQGVPHARSGATSGPRRAAWNRCSGIAGPIPRIAGPVATRDVSRGTSGSRHNRYPLSPQDIDDEISGMRIATMTPSEPALRTAYLMVHDDMERGFIPVVASDLDSPRTIWPSDYSRRRSPARSAIDEDISKAVVIDEQHCVTQSRSSCTDRPSHSGGHQRPPRGPVDHVDRRHNCITRHTHPPPGARSRRAGG